MQSTAGPSEMVIKGEYALLGMYLPSIEGRHIKKARASYHNLDLWLEASGFDFRRRRRLYNFHALGYVIIREVEHGTPALAAHARDEAQFRVLLRDILFNDIASPMSSGSRSDSQRGLLGFPSGVASNCMRCLRSSSAAGGLRRSSSFGTISVVLGTFLL